MGCASYQTKVSEPRRLIQQSQPAQAAELLAPMALQPSKDQLVYLLDYATALQMAHNFTDSTKAYLKADKLAEELDYVSVTQEAGRILTNEEFKSYQGDTFEKIFINAELALNYLAIGQLDEALVEARRINQKFSKLRKESKRNFELNPFAQYLTGLLWEADQRWDDAAIAYSDAYKIAPATTGLAEDLVRISQKAHRNDDYLRWKNKFKGLEEDPEWKKSGNGQIVVLVQQGWGPRKEPDPGNFRFPILRSVPSNTKAAKVEFPVGAGQPSVITHEIYNVTEAAIATLNDDRGALLARRLGGVVAKEIAADQIRQKNELLGLAAWVTLHVTDRADLRQWSTLPSTIQMARIFAKPGTYNINLVGVDAAGNPTGERKDNVSVVVQSKKIAFVLWDTKR